MALNRNQTCDSRHKETLRPYASKEYGLHPTSSTILIPSVYRPPSNRISQFGYISISRLPHKLPRIERSTTANRSLTAVWVCGPALNFRYFSDKPEHTKSYFMIHNMAYATDGNNLILILPINPKAVKEETSFMKIAVMIKQVPDTDEVKMDPETGTMVREGVDGIINPLDLNALQAAFDLRRDEEISETSVTVFSMGPPNAEEALREALALGADDAYLLSDRKFAGSDTWSTSKTLSAFLEKTGPYDLILAGGKATDGETGQVGPEVAAMLDIPCSTYVSSIKCGSGSVDVIRTVEEGLQKQRLRMPCLLTVLHDINEPSMPTLAGKKRGRRAEIGLVTMEKLGMDENITGLKGSPTRVVKIRHPQISRNTRFFSGKDIDRGIEETIGLLKDMALL